MIAWERKKQDNLKRILEKYSRPAAPVLPVTSSSIDYKSRWSSFLDDFCRNSTIHGIKYMGDRNRHWAERLWWLVAFLLSIFGCARLCLNVWSRWDRNPVIVTFAEKSTPIWQIPFPACTICVQTKAQANLFNYTYYSNLIALVDLGLSNYTFSEIELHQIDAMSQVCDPRTDNTSVGGFATSPDLISVLEELTPPMADYLFRCKWRNVDMACEDIFSKILTEEGICYTFNNLDQSEIFREENLNKDYRYIEKSAHTSGQWSIETGYVNESNIDSYPERVQTAGARAGLFVVLPLDTADMDYICRGPSQGFKIQLHTPGEVPLLSQQYFRLSVDQELTVSVKPNMMTTSEVLRSYAISRRQCYFNDERYLRYFKVYTQQNCELECLTNYTIDKCGCVKFSMPRDKDTMICGARSVPCYYLAEDELLNPYDGPTFSELGCDCLPACTSISYDGETSTSDFDWRRLLEAYSISQDAFPGLQLARLSIFFRDSQFITSKRSELYGPTDFMANCGGLLGLFMGVSILSLVEILYFFTLRIYYSLKTRRGRSAAVQRVSP